MYRISFCTAIRNRLHHLKQTLKQNIEDNSSYPELQFVILDYNSDDGLTEWISTEMSFYLSSGKVVYYRTEDPAFFDRSHSRNLAFKLAEGDIICNIDADNFTGENFADYINNLFQSTPGIFITSGKLEAKIRPDFLGRIGVRKSDFLAVGGYDEKMDGYGFEDIDLINRLIRYGLSQHKINQKAFFRAVFHSDEERILEERKMKLIVRLYISHINPSESDVILLFGDNKFQKGRVINTGTQHSQEPSRVVNNHKTTGQFTLAETDWQTGGWFIEKGCLTLSIDNNNVLFKVQRRCLLSENGQQFFWATDPAIISNLIMFNSQFSNKKRMKDKQVKEINNAGIWGQGNVSKNLDMAQMIQIT